MNILLDPDGKSKAVDQEKGGGRVRTTAPLRSIEKVTSMSVSDSQHPRKPKTSGKTSRAKRKRIPLGKWWRAYSADRDNVVLQMLPLDIFRGWYNLSCLAGESAGNLPPISQIAFSLRMQPHQAVDLVDALIDAGLVEQTLDSPPRLRMGLWAGRQYVEGDPAERMARYRKRQKDCATQADQSSNQTTDENACYVTVTELVTGKVTPVTYFSSTSSLHCEAVEVPATEKNDTGTAKGRGDGSPGRNGGRQGGALTVDDSAHEGTRSGRRRR